MAKLAQLSNFIPACNNIDFVYLNERKGYVTCTTPIFEHLISNQQMSSKAKLFYLLVYCIANISAKQNRKKYGQINVAKTYPEWLDLLGWSKTTFFTIKQELQNLGYIKNAGYAIIPILPDLVFSELKLSPNRYNAPEVEYLCNIKCLAATKPFIKINLSLLKQLLIEPHINDLDKLLWLHCFKRSYLAHLDKNGEGERAFLQQQKELAKIFNRSQSNILRSLSRLERAGYLNKEYLKKVKIIDTEGVEGFCSLYLLEARLPVNKMDKLKSQADRAGLYALSEEEQFEYGLIRERQNPRETSYLSKAVLNLPSTPSRMSNFGLSTANSGISTANFGISKANSEPILLNKDLILKNSIRDPNADRVLDKSTITSNKGKILAASESQIAAAALPSSVVTSKIVREEEAAGANPINKEKISQLLKAAKDKLALINSKTKAAENVKGSRLPNTKKTLTMQANNPIPANEEQLSLIKSQNKAHRDVVLTKEISNIPGEAIRPRQALNKDLAIQAIPEPNPLDNNIIKFPGLNIAEDKIVPKGKKSCDPEWENPLHYYIYADLYKAICKSISARNEERATDYAIALRHKFPHKYKTWDTLFYELKYYAATYKPKEFMPRDKEKVALVNAWKLVVAGKWETPRALAKIDSLSREAKYHVEKYLSFGKRAITPDMQEVFYAISCITGKPCQLEDLVGRYNQEEV